MKLKLTGFLAACGLALGLLVGPGQAQVVFDPADPEKATGINDLDVGGTIYNVTFTGKRFASEVYGPFPGSFDFPDSASAAAAVDALDVALQAAGALRVGAEEMPSGAQAFRIAFDGTESEAGAEQAAVWEGLLFEGSWLRAAEATVTGYNDVGLVWADFTLAGEQPPQSIRIEPTDSECENCVYLVLTNDVPVRGGQVGIGFDPGAVDPIAAEPGPDFPQSSDSRILFSDTPANGCPPTTPGGFVVGWINSLEETVLTEPGEHRLIKICFGEGESRQDTCSSLEFVTCLGNPPVSNIVVGEAGERRELETTDGEICLAGRCNVFSRGDVNTDGTVDIADAVGVLTFLFEGGRLRCLDAADVNDNGGLSVSDPIYLFELLFAGGPPPPPPSFDSCGVDPTPDELDCESFLPCVQPGTGSISGTLVVPTGSAPEQGQGAGGAVRERKRVDRGNGGQPPGLAASSLERVERWVEGQVLVKLSGGTIEALIARHPQLNLELFGSIEVLQTHCLEVRDAKAAVEQLAGDPWVIYADYNWIATTHLDPNDPLYEKQWHYENMNLPLAWEMTTGDASIVVAVIDSGIIAHEDLDDNVLDSGYDFVSSNTGDGNGPDPDPTDTGSYHGTHCAGTIGAVTNNGVGLSGVNWDVGILPVRVMNGDGYGSTFDIAHGILYAAGIELPGVPLVPTPARVMNLSLGIVGVDSPIMREAIQDAAAQGVVIIASAGNEGNDELNYPAAYPEAVSVSALNPGNKLAYYSSFGETIEVAAPGGEIVFPSDAEDGVLSTYRGRNDQPYWYLQGTSMAGPHVAGLAALILSVNPALTADEVRTILSSTAVDLGPEGRDDRYGNGAVDAAAAIREVSSTLPEGDPDPLVTPSSLLFGPGVNDATVLVRNEGGGDLAVTAVNVILGEGESWLSATLVKPEIPAQVEVVSDSQGLAPATYQGTVEIVTDPTVVRDAVQEAAARGVLIIASAGNEASDEPNYPAAYPEAVSVSALNPSNRLAYYSNYGDTIELAAPGGEIRTDPETGVLSTYRGESDEPYWYLHGTSMAAPHVAGLAALILSVNPELSADEVRTILSSTAVDLAPPGRDDRFGNGGVNAAAAIREALSSAPEGDPDPLVTPSSLLFGPGLDGATLIVRNEGGGELAVTGVNVIMDDGDGWLSATLAKPDIPAQVEVASDSEGLADGTYRGRVEIATDAGSETVEVVLGVGPPPELPPSRVSLVDAAAGTTVATVDTSADEGYAFSFTDLAPGAYLLEAATGFEDGQVDEDDFIGQYPLFGDPSPVVIRLEGNDVADLTIPMFRAGSFGEVSEGAE